MNHKLISQLQDSYEKKKPLIKSRLNDFKRIRKNASDEQLFEEMTFCILAAGTSAKMALNSVEAVKDILSFGDFNQIRTSLIGHYRYPNLRANHIIQCREYLKSEYDFKIKDMISNLKDPIERRGFLATIPQIKGIGFKEASHFLRNIGYSSYAILDKHIIYYLYELKLIKSNEVPSTENRYLETEKILINFSKDIGINIDELDLLLWSEKTGEILK
ncbi:MAG: N-glycosylase/DNA lyase [Candidatus Dadabacteria bacterium]|nr:N-glycosylase/DNA lyase [Candidatus Dadabacteria bacterium]NIX14820.1 N-glycosylase/DNA lyase [Candidatus Dadabacteria bacterium]